jgi:hypothetical protein
MLLPLTPMVLSVGPLVLPLISMALSAGPLVLCVLGGAGGGGIAWRLPPSWWHLPPQQHVCTVTNY